MTNLRTFRHYTWASKGKEYVMITGTLQAANLQMENPETGRMKRVDEVILTKEQVQAALTKHQLTLDGTDRSEVISYSSYPIHITAKRQRQCHRKQ